MGGGGDEGGEEGEEGGEALNESCLCVCVCVCVLSLARWAVMNDIFCNDDDLTMKDKG